MSTPLLENILNQPRALLEVARHHLGDGREALERAATLLGSRKQVLLSGMGASCFACIPFQYMLSRGGFNVSCVETAELLYFRPESFGPDTTVVLVSRSGESIEVTKLLDLLGQASSAVLGVMNCPDSALGHRANESLLLNSPADQLVAIQTYTATLATFALLEAAVSGELDQAKVELERTSALLTNKITQWVEVREQWRPFLATGGPLYVLGRGPALGAVSEGVLLMHEVAKAPAIGMSVPQFRHGPVEVVDGDFRAVIIGTQSETAELDSALANDLIGMGGQVRWLGPNVEHGIAPHLCQWEESIPKRFVPIAETIPLQILAYAKAEISGFRPGDFRWASAITKAESGFPAPRHV